MSLNPSSIGMLLLVLKEEGRDKSYQIVSDMNAELTRLAPYAKMVEQMEILAKEGYRVGFDDRFGVFISKGVNYTREPSDSIVTSFTTTLTALLSSLPDSQRTKLAAKLGVE